ncbi:MAG TPA: FAD-dependent monooxygenase [Steroidobacteraceae bacterium]|jgi:2-polyprenyl-6-methoxyphenol hydroxylase-like FAD-dependent oxidoreductase
MKITIVGAGPSGLYLSLLMKKHFAAADVCVLEQNPRGISYGFGIVLAERGLKCFRKAHAASYEALITASFISRNRVISHPDESLFIEGGGYGGAISRLRLLEILEGSCEREGIRLEFNARVDNPGSLDDADLVVGADGVNSMVRQHQALEFGTKTYSLSNRVAWFGTTRHFPYPMLCFKRYNRGHFVMAAYAYSEQMGCFVAECDEATYQRSGLESMSEDEQREFTETVFGDELKGHSLISNKSAYRRLPVVRNREWHVGNRVLIGDALHSTHPSIGSGTRMAMEDSIALADALAFHRGDLNAGLVEFRRSREPAKSKLLLGSEKSFNWYETFGRKVDELNAVDFVFEFLMRTGRISRQRLIDEYPLFMNRHGRRWQHENLRERAIP